MSWRALEVKSLELFKVFVLPLSFPKRFLKILSSNSFKKVHKGLNDACLFKTKCFNQHV